MIRKMGTIEGKAANGANDMTAIIITIAATIATCYILDAIAHPGGVRYPGEEG